MEQYVGLAKVSLTYGQPSKQGRQIFGGLIPYGKIWRTGANSSTKISFDREVKLADQVVPAGDYGLYTIPGEKQWTIIIHKNNKLWGAGGYQDGNDLLRFEVPSQKLNDLVESLTIRFEGFHANGANLVIAWENTKVSFPVFVDSDATILAEIDEKLVNNTGKISAQTYFDAAQFYFHKNMKLDLAVTWFDKAIELSPRAFWYVYYRGEIAFEMGDYKNAKKYTEQCLAAAQKSPSSDFGYIGKCDLLLAKIADKM